MKPNLTIVGTIVGAFAVLTVISTVFMPAAELIPAQVKPAAPVEGRSPFRSNDLMAFFNNLGQQGIDAFGPTDKKDGKRYGMTALVDDQGQAGAPYYLPNAPYYLYSIYLAMALVASAIAINAIGRLDSEEETIVPVKK